MIGGVRDLFAGPGGWDEGLRRLVGVADVVGLENDPAACATAEANGHRRACVDIAAADPLDYGRPGELAGVIASPPCPGFSGAGSGLGRKDLPMLSAAIQELAYGADADAVLAEVRAKQHDPRSALTLEPLRWIMALEPEWFALEQVPAVLPLWVAYVPALEALGYDVWAGYVTAERFGVPQTRKRAVARGSRRRRGIGEPRAVCSRFHPRDPLRVDEGMPRWVSMSEAVGWDRDVTMISNYGTGGDPKARGERSGAMPAPTVTSKIGRNKVRAPVAMGDVASSRGCVRDVDQPSPTLTSSMDNGNFRWVFAGAGATSEQTAGQVPRELDAPAHTITGKGTAAWKPRGEAPEGTPSTVRVTVQEAATLQTFPASYRWEGRIGDHYQQIGNAVPPLMAAHILAPLIGVAAPELTRGPW